MCILIVFFVRDGGPTNGTLGDAENGCVTRGKCNTLQISSKATARMTIRYISDFIFSLYNFLMSVGIYSAVIF